MYNFTNWEKAYIHTKILSDYAVMIAVVNDPIIVLKQTLMVESHWPPLFASLALRKGPCEDSEQTTTYEAPPCTDTFI